MTDEEKRDALARVRWHRPLLAWSEAVTAHAANVNRQIASMLALGDTAEVVVRQHGFDLGLYLTWRGAQGEGEAWVPPDADLFDLWAVAHAGLRGRDVAAVRAERFGAPQG